MQQRGIRTLREEVDYLHTVSLMIMEDRGILPPFYGGDTLDEDDREILPLWGILPDDDEQLGLVLLRLRPHAEPNRELRQARRMTGMSNSWSLERLLKALGSEDRPIPIEGGAEIRSTKIALALFGEQCVPAAGFTQDGLLDAFETGQPMAIFVHAPVIGDGEAAFYAWGDVEHFRAEVLYADSAEELEMAVWRYRMEMALSDERFACEVEGKVPADEMFVTDVPELAALFDLMVVDATRYYGVTSPIRERQAALDILRGFDGDLVVQAPVRAEVEPVRLLAEAREEMYADMPPGEVLIRLKADGAAMTQVWPQIRAHSHFCIRFRRGEFIVTKKGGLRVQGMLDHPIIEWILADSQENMYAKVTLHCLRQLLASVGKIRVVPRLIEPDGSSTGNDDPGLNLAANGAADDTDDRDGSADSE